MKIKSCFVLILFITGLLLGCASSIVDGEYIKTSSDILVPKQSGDVIDIFFSDKKPKRPNTEIGRVNARSYVLEKGIDELKNQAREIGADAIKNITYERKFSADYLQDLYFLTGVAVIWK